LSQNGVKGGSEQIITHIMKNEISNRDKVLESHFFKYGFMTFRKFVVKVGKIRRET